MIRIDGSQGEGGGQILRSALCLSAITALPFEVTNIRQGRSKPGLQPQHLAAVHAAQAICGANVDGDRLSSRRLVFRPSALTGGDYSFPIGTAGSSSLVLQTAVPALLFTGAPSTVRVDGGTHNPFAPPFDFLDRTWAPLARRLGASVELCLERPGFYPAGQGAVEARIEPWTERRTAVWDHRGDIRVVRAKALVSKLPREIAEREIASLAATVGPVANELECTLETEVIEETRAVGPGNVCWVEVEAEHVTEVFTGFGRKGVRAEAVASEAGGHAVDYLTGTGFAGPYLADQLLLLMALSGAGSFTATELTPHALTNMEIIAKFLPVVFEKSTEGGDGQPLVRRVTIAPRPTGKTP